jgi:two-component system sensor histidine kinase YesM
MIDGNRVYVYRKLDYNNWYVVMNHPASILSASNSAQGNALQIMIFVALVIALTLVFILAYNYSVSVTVSRINTSLDALNAGKDAPPEDLPQFLDPLHQLERNADQMVLTVKELMENQYQDRIAIAESQMKSLQAQIKPHFLYNTLDIIKWMILDQKNDEAAQMVNTLSKYLRQSINKGPGIIALREELELSKTYISIMQTRFKNRFTVFFEIEEAAQIYQIPKLSLQPLLENALLHGILYCEKPDKELFVRAWVADGSVYIEIEDNGNGISEETVRELEAGTTGYGLGNVRKRLALFSKGQGEFNIFSREGFGTCITIRIPAIIAENQIP